jgi:hypothetical protein
MRDLSSSILSTSHFQHTRTSIPLRLSLREKFLHKHRLKRHRTSSEMSDQRSFSIPSRSKRTLDTEEPSPSVAASSDEAGSLAVSNPAKVADEADGSAKRQRLQSASASTDTTPATPTTPRRGTHTSMGPPTSPVSTPPHGRGSRKVSKSSPSAGSSPDSRGSQRPTVNPYPELDEESFPKRDARVEKPSSPSYPNRIILPAVSPGKKLFTKSSPVAPSPPTRSEASSPSATTIQGDSSVPGAVGAAGQERKEQGGGTASYDPFVEK